MLYFHVGQYERIQDHSSVDVAISGLDWRVLSNSSDQEYIMKCIIKQRVQNQHR